MKIPRKVRKEYIRYSDEQLERARNMDMVNYLERAEGFTFHRRGSYYICDEHNSLNVEFNRKTWHWNSQKTGGLNVIDWLMKIDGYSFQEACRLVIGDGEVIKSSRAAFIKAAETKKEKKPFELPVKANAKYANVYMYLTQTRGISSDVVKYCFDKKIVYQDTHRNCVFVGYDDDNVAKFAEVRSTASDVVFRYNVESSMKEFSFHINAENDMSDRVFVFESPIDLLSHITLNQINAEQYCADRGTEYNKDCWKKHNRLSLSGSSDIALESYLKRFPTIKKIAVCCDNDEAGKTLSEFIKNKYTEQGYVVTVHNASYGKDYNDMLCHIRETQADNSIQVNESQHKR